MDPTVGTPAPGRTFATSRRGRQLHKDQGKKRKKKKKKIAMVVGLVMGTRSGGEMMWEVDRRDTRAG